MGDRLTDERVERIIAADSGYGEHVKSLAREVRTSRKLVADLLAHHHNNPQDGRDWCNGCGDDWPCFTVRLITEAKP